MTGDGPDGPPPAPLLPLEVPPLELLPPLVLPPLVLPPLEPPTVPLLLPLLLPPGWPKLPELLLPEPLDPLPPLSPVPLDPLLDPEGVDQGSVVFEDAQAAAAAQVPTQNDTICKRFIFPPSRLRRRRNASSGPSTRATSFPRKQRSMRRTEP
jgi:hypothetical protein